MPYINSTGRMGSIGPTDPTDPYTSILEAMHKAQSAITVRFVGQAMEADDLRVALGANELRLALIARVPDWLKAAETSEDYTFLANAIAGIANLAVITKQEAHVAETKAAFACWKTELATKPRVKDAKWLLGKINNFEEWILDAALPRRTHWDLITK
jgi:hypothetical protein